MRRVLRLIVVVQLIAGVVLAATVEPDEDGVQTTASTATSSSTTTASATTAPAQAAPTTAAPTTAAPAKPTTTTTTAPPVLKNKPAGEYAYRLRVTEDGTTKNYAGTLAYFTARETDGEVRQLVIDDNEHDSFSTRTTYAWRPDGVYVLSTHEDGIDHDERCDFEPDLLVYPSPMVVGKQWTLSSACAPVRVEATSRVVRMETVSVGGRRVAVHVVETQGRVSGEGAEAGFHSVDWFSVEHGLSVREETTYTAPQGEYKEANELLSLDPKPIGNNTTTTT